MNEWLEDEICLVWRRERKDVKMMIRKVISEPGQDSFTKVERMSQRPPLGWCQIL